MYIDGDIAINLICPKFLSLLMTGVIRIGGTERGSFKKYIWKQCKSCSSKPVHNLKLPLTYSEFTVHMQNQLKAGSFVGTKKDVHFFSYARAMEWTVLRWPY